MAHPSSMLRLADVREAAYAEVEQLLQDVLKDELPPVKPRVADALARKSSRNVARMLRKKLKRHSESVKEDLNSVIAQAQALEAATASLTVTVDVCEKRRAWVPHQQTALSRGWRTIHKSTNAFLAQSTHILFQLDSAAEAAAANSFVNICRWSRLCLFIVIATTTFAVSPGMPKYSGDDRVDAAIKETSRKVGVEDASGAVLLKLLDVACCLRRAPSGDKLAEAHTDHGNGLLRAIATELGNLPPHLRRPDVSQSSSIWDLLEDYLTTAKSSSRVAASMRRVEVLGASKVGRELVYAVRVLLRSSSHLRTVKPSLDKLCKEMEACLQDRAVSDRRNKLNHLLPPNTKDVALAMAYSGQHFDRSWPAAAVHWSVVLTEVVSGQLEAPCAWDDLYDALTTMSSDAQVAEAIALSLELQLRDGLRDGIGSEHETFMELCRTVHGRCLSQRKVIREAAWRDLISWQTDDGAPSTSRLTVTWYHSLMVTAVGASRSAVRPRPTPRVFAVRGGEHGAPLCSAGFKLPLHVAWGAASRDSVWQGVGRRCEGHRRWLPVSRPW